MEIKSEYKEVVIHLFFFALYVTLLLHFIENCYLRTNV